MQELELYVDGYMMREAKHLNGARKLWQLLFNVNVSKQQNRISDSDLAEMWPLFIDPENNPKLAKQEKIRRETEAEMLRSKFRSLSQKVREYDQHRNSGNIRSTDSPSS